MKHDETEERLAQIEHDLAETDPDIRFLLSLCRKQGAVVEAAKDILRKSRIHLTIEDWKKLEAALEVTNDA